MTAAPTARTAWAPLLDARFRALWTAFLTAQVVIWAQTVGAVDVISGQTSSATAVAGIQTAVSLPGVALGLLAGAFADVSNRRRLLIGACVSMAITMIVLAVLTSAGSATPAVVLILTCSLGAGLAMFLPAFLAMVPDLVPPEMIASAVAMNGISVNLARAAGPPLAGVIIAVAGTDGLFWVLSAALLGAAVALARRGPSFAAPERPESIGEAVRAGVRYARFSEPLRRVLVRTSVFVVSASALWALLPVVAVRRLGLDASGFGALLGCTGIGAVVGALCLPWLRPRWGFDGLLAGGNLLLAASFAGVAFVGTPWVAGVIVFAAGAAWILALNSVATAAQTVVPAWVRGRALSTFFLAYQTGLAVGSLIWGVVAERSLEAALLIPAAGLVASALLGHTHRLPAIGEMLKPSGYWDAPVVASDVPPEAGPVLVTVQYRVAPADLDAFVDAMTKLAAVRRRDGARDWNLYRDVGEAGSYLETFTAGSWGEHLRQHDRGTQVDLPLEERALELGGEHVVRHLIRIRRR